MKILKIKHIVLLSFILLTAFDQNNPVMDGIIASMRSGEAKKLVTYFHTSIDLVVLDKEDVYSKDQAEVILADFFTKHSPKNFNIQHSGGKDSNKYVIGVLQTMQGTFRVYIYMKNINNKMLVHTLRINKND